MKVKYLKGDQKGEVGYLGYHEAQAALQAGAVEVIQGEEAAKAGDEADKAEIASGAPDYSAMTKAELEQAAKDRSIDVPSGATKVEIIDLLKA